MFENEQSKVLQYRSRRHVSTRKLFLASVRGLSKLTNGTRTPGSPSSVLSLTGINCRRRMKIGRKRGMSVKDTDDQFRVGAVTRRPLRDPRRRIKIPSCIARAQ
jgi:hypothetical protein